MKSWSIIMILVSLFGMTLAGCGEQGGSSPEKKKKAVPTREGVIVALGDSLTAGYGLAEDEAYPALLEKMLRDDGYGYRVVNAGINGETSAGVLSRLRRVMELDPDIVILETGINDALQGIHPDLIGKNIDAVVASLKSRGIAVILCGMKMPLMFGYLHGRAFAEIYPEVAEKYGVALMPFFLEGVADDVTLNMDDGVHPTAEGYRIIARNLYPYVKKEAERKR